MDKKQLRQSIEQQRGEDQVFIKWEPIPEGSVGIENLDYFLKTLLDSTDVDSFELLNLEQLWQELIQNSSDCFERVWRNKVEIIDWHFKSADGANKMRSCCFRAEGLLAMYEEAMSGSK